MSSESQGWAPVVSGPIVVAALERVALLAGRSRATPRRVRHDLGGGGAGLAVVCEQLDRCRPGAGWRAMAESWLAAAEAGADRPQVTAPGLFGGMGGPVFAAWVLEPERPARATAIAPRVDDPRAGPELDLISGLTGTCTNLLGRAADPAAGAALCAGLAVLCRSAEPGVWTRSGLAHGVAGPLALLSLAFAADLRVNGQRAAIERLIALLGEYRQDDAWGPNWRAGADSRAAHGSWCAGAPGIARALWLAGDALDDEATRALAVDALAAVLARPDRQRLVDRAPGLCHGLAGLLQVTVRFAHDTGDPRWGAAATRLTEELLVRHPTPGDAGPGLLDGAAGVILALLAATTATPPRWDRALLLA
ncbi:lanthionine synthetase LanC family protein [Embleya sp. NPDC005971]|uniref:lanthionine synthetase LanC family protein n=1 Tax=Embleya sp. NPDC005971 TaxID=3156724 RepID=UPI0034006035